MSLTAIYSTVGKTCLVLAGILSCLYSVMGIFALFGVGISIHPIEDLLTIYLCFAFPVFLLAMVSVRLAALSLWCYFFLDWVRCFVIGWPVICKNPVDSLGGKILLVIAVLATLAYMLFAKVYKGSQIPNLKRLLKI
jgi:hypothetical protein